MRENVNTPTSYFIELFFHFTKKIMKNLIFEHMNYFIHVLIFKRSNFFHSSLKFREILPTLPDYADMLNLNIKWVLIVNIKRKLVIFDLF